MGVAGAISSLTGWCSDCLHLRATITNVAIGTLGLCYFGPAMLAHGLLYPLFRLVFGTLYPAYASYKAVRAKNVKEYVKWMMYWIVFALFTCAETFTDVFLSFWFPFYYEFKVILVLWLLSPATKGSSILYRKFVHPMLTKREQEIDEYLARAKDQSYHTVLALGTKGVNYATSVIMQTAIKGGGGLVNQLRRSYSLGDISSDIDTISDRVKQHPDDQVDHTDAPIDARLLRPRGYNTRSSPSGGIVEMYFPEMDLDVRQRKPRSREPSIPLSQIRSNEDISSGYSSGEVVYAGGGHDRSEEAQEQPLVRTSSVGSTRVTRTKMTPRTNVGTTKRTQPTEDSVSSSDEREDTDSENQEDQFFDVSNSPLPLSVPFLKTASLPLSPQSAPGQIHVSTNPSTASQDQPFVTIQSAIDLNNQAPSPVQVPYSFEKDQLVPSVETESVPYDLPIVNMLAEDAPAVEISVPPNVLEELCKTDTTQVKSYSNEIDVSVDAEDVFDIAPIRMPFVILPSPGCVSCVTGSMKTPPLSSVGSNVPETQDTEQILNCDRASSVIQDNTELKVEDKQTKIIFTEPPDMIPPEQETSVVILGSDETEFVDAENEVFEDTSSDVLPIDDAALTCPNNKDTISSDVNNDNVSSKSDVSIEIVPSDSGKVDRAGKYNKRPAPCPPKQSEVEILKPDLDGALEITTSNSDTIAQVPQPAKELEPLKPEAVDGESILVPHLPTSLVDPEETAERSPGATKKQTEMHEVGEESLRFHIPPRPVSIPSVKSNDSGNTKSDVSLTSSPIPPQKKAKSKQDSPISRLFSMPKSHLTALFPFLGHSSSHGLTATSLTSLSGDLEEQLRSAMHGSLTNIPTASSSSGGNAMRPPLLPPRKKSQGENEGDVTRSAKNFDKNEGMEGSERQFRMREMSHSPPRRQTDL